MHEDRETKGAECDQLMTIKPPVNAADLKADTEYDPEGADEFVTLIQALRKEGR